MATQKTIAILGAGIAGPTFALQILAHPTLRSLFRPLLFDAAPAPGSLQDRAGASVGLLANGLAPLFDLGLRDAILRHGAECLDIAVWQCDYQGTHEKLNTQEGAMRSGALGVGVYYFERGGLQEVLLDAVSARGGEGVQWGKKALQLLRGESKTTIAFADGTTFDADMVVGADGGYSAVRRHILEQKNPQTAAARWLPDFHGMTGIYGISSVEAPYDGAEAELSETHAAWLDRGFLASGPCPGGKIRWDLILPEATPPGPGDNHNKGIPEGEGEVEAWQAVIVPSSYALSSTVDILCRHKDVHHPYAGNLEALLNSADRIVRTPLRQRVWKEEEIQHESCVVIGDAARLMLPTSGQGTGFAIEDATVLASTLLQHATSANMDWDSSIRKALEAYARERVPRSTKMGTVSWLTGKLGLGGTWYYRAMRYYGSKWSTSNGSKQGADSWPMDGRFRVDHRKER